MKNMKNLSTTTEVKIAAAEFFVKYMREVFYQEMMENSKEVNMTGDILVKVEEYLEKLESN